MMKRCYDPLNEKYHRYGARGIIVYDQWHDLSTYIKDIEHILGQKTDMMSIDRIDNDGNYTPDNVRWATDTEQQNNRGDHTSIHRGGVVTQDIADELRRRHLAGESRLSLRKEFNISHTTMGRIIRYEIWNADAI